jgi:rhamnosyltransferase
MIGDSNQQIMCSIVIRAYNEAKLIERLLIGIEQQTIKSIEVIVVDSGSSDDTAAIAAKHNAKIINISPEEFTFGRSLNRGIAAGQGEFIVIVSAHCFPVYPDWLERLLAPFTDENTAITYGKQRGGETNHFSEHQIFKKYYPEISQLRQGNPFSHNANSAIRRVLWEKNPFNENLTGLEDLAWSSWVMEENYGIAYISEAEVIHQHEENPQQVLNRHFREAVAMKQILPDSKFTFWNFLRLWQSSVYSDLLAARRDSVFVSVWWSIIWFRFLQYFGTYRGYHYSGKIDSNLHRTFYYPPNILDDKNPVLRDVRPIEYNVTEAERNTEA